MPLIFCIGNFGISWCFRFLAKKHNCASAYRWLGDGRASAFWLEAHRFCSPKLESRRAGLPSSRCGSPPPPPPTSTALGTDGRPVWCGRTKFCAYAKKAGAGPARPDCCWNSELFGAVEFARLLLKLLIAEIIGHRPTMALSQPSCSQLWTFFDADAIKQLLTLTPF